MRLHKESTMKYFYLLTGLFLYTLSAVMALPFSMLFWNDYKKSIKSIPIKLAEDAVYLGVISEVKSVKIKGWFC